MLLGAITGCNGVPANKSDDKEFIIWVDHHKDWHRLGGFGGEGYYSYRVSNAATPDFSLGKISAADIFDFFTSQVISINCRWKKITELHLDASDTQYQVVSLEDKQLATEPFEIEIPKQQDFHNTSGTIKFSPGSNSPVYNCVPEVCDTVKAMPNREDIVFIA
jgi:hypothetical protein